MDTIIITTNAALSVLCWLIVAAGATTAVFAHAIDDTISERIGLAGVAIACIGTACRVISAGWVSDGGMTLSLALAFYVVAIFCKHWRMKHRRKA